MRILLFDIDGTLVRTGGAGKLAMESALLAAFGIRDVQDVVPYSGRTDLAIASDLLHVHGIDPTREHQERLTETYLDHLPEQLAEASGIVCPGIPELLAEVHANHDVLLGLLTGNVHRGARIKLSHYGLWDYFRLGGFGDGHHDRNDVARSALQSVERHLQRAVDPQDIWVIGDTPLDVSCARAIGANVLAVATGWHSLSDLKAAGPDLALPDLTETAAVLKAWKLNP
jgi:phosphoglycolate phosphatase-like HAD superfamily hydrolase